MQKKVRFRHILQKLYNDLGKATFLSSPALLLKYARQKNKNITLSNVKEFLDSLDAENKHRKIISRFKRRPVITSGIADQFQIDLLDLTPVAKENRGIKFLLTCIDCFSRKAYVRGIKSKHGQVVTKAMEDIIRGGKFPRGFKLQSDRGREFLNQYFQNLCQKYDIHHFQSNSPFKCQIVERFQRTLRKLLGKFMTHKNTLSYIDNLKQIIATYNNTPHSTLRHLSPNDITKENEKQVWNMLYSKHISDRGKASPKFRKGEFVRTQRKRNMFDTKETEPGWTQKLFQIQDIIYTNPPIYKLRSVDSGKIVNGTFYAQQLSRVIKNDLL